MPSIPAIVIGKRTLVREGISSLLHNTVYNVIMTSPTVSKLTEFPLPTDQPALAIVGITGNFNDALEEIQTVRRQVPSCTIMVVGELTGELNGDELLRNGADGVLLNVSSREVLLKALELSFLDQQLIVGPRTARNAYDDNVGPRTTSNAYQENMAAIAPHLRLNSPDGEDCDLWSVSLHQLSEREQEILLLVAHGATNKSIAHTFSIAEGTVKAHLKTILRKLSVRNRTQAALWAVENGLLSQNLHELQGRNISATKGKADP
jgi:two-component system nitrate/nitrite response regulator NarL